MCLYEQLTLMSLILVFLLESVNKDKLLLTLSILTDTLMHSYIVSSLDPTHTGEGLVTCLGSQNVGVGNVNAPIRLQD